jgi:HAD superfamily hydrolase (TIGR01509 family)
VSTCILFDCDGTLVDSEGLCNLAMAKKFAELGVILDADELTYRYRGWQLAKILDALTEEYQVDLPEGFVTRYRELVAQLFERQLQPIEGIQAALAQLPQRKAVVSSGPLHKIRHAPQLCGLSGYFGDHIYSAYELGTWKPDPTIYLEAARDMGFAPAQCVVVEDSPTGVEAGVRAGMSTLFYNKFDDPVPLSGVTSFTSMDELPDLIRALRS